MKSEPKEGKTKRACLDIAVGMERLRESLRAISSFGARVLFGRGTQREKRRIRKASDCQPVGRGHGSDCDQNGYAAGKLV